MSDNSNMTRREFVYLTTMAGGSLLRTNPIKLFAATGPAMNIKSRGYAAVDTSGKLVPWEFERRPVGDDDVLIETKAASICHSDIHQKYAAYRHMEPVSPGCNAGSNDLDCKQSGLAPKLLIDIETGER